MKFFFLLTWSGECIIEIGTADTQEPKFAITDKNLYFPVVTLSAQYNAKLLQQLKTGFKRTINWNKYQTQNRYLNYLIDPSFQEVNRIFIFPFENNAHQKGYKQYFDPTVEIKDYNVMIDEKNFFDQPVKSDLRIHENIRKIVTGERDDYNYYNWLFARL